MVSQTKICFRAAIQHVAATKAFHEVSTDAPAFKALLKRTKFLNAQSDDVNATQSYSHIPSGGS